MTRAAVAQLCSAGTVPSLILGTYTGAQLTTGAGAGTITCNSGTKYTIALDKGSGPGATTTMRQMRLNGVGVTLNYQLFQNSSHTLNWGNTTDVLTGTGTGGNQNYTIFPSIPAGQYAPTGTYTDTVNASVTDSGSYSEPFTVTATVTTTCSISASNLNFGNYNGTVVNSSTTLSVTCTNKTTYSIGFDNGQHSAYIGAWAKYMMGPSSNLLRYHIYTDCTRSTEWGNTSQGGVQVAGTGTGTAQSIPVCGTIGAGSYGSVPGYYSDTETITLTY